MARTPEPGIPAQFNYQNVKYFPFGNKPAEPMLLTADPWSFLFAWLGQHRPKRGPHRRNSDRALYYGRLAEGFYLASEQTVLPTKGTLSYYGMLNLVKTFISVRGVELESTYEHHGLSLPPAGSNQITVASPSAGSLNIFHEFAAQLGTPVTGKKTVKLQDICSHCESASHFDPGST